MANIGSLTATLGIDTRGLSRAERTFRGTIGRMKREVFSLKGALVALGSAFVLHELKKGIMEVTHMAGRYEELGVAMRVAGENAGFSADQMALFQKGVEKAGIAAIEARQVLTRMSVANIDLAKSTKLARAAQDLAVVGAINSSEAFERLIYGIQTAQVRVLRTIGLNVTFEQGYERLADKLDKTTKELTIQEKTQSRVNTVLEAATRYQGLYEQAMTSAEKQFRSLKRHVDNFKVALGEAFQPAYLSIVQTFTDLFKDLKNIVGDVSFQIKVERIAKRVSDVFGLMIDTILGKMGDLKKIGEEKDYFGKLSDAVVGTMKTIAYAVAATSDSFRGLHLIVLGLKEAFLFFEHQFEKFAVRAAKSQPERGYLGKTVDEWIAREKKTLENLQKTNQILEGIATKPLAMTEVTRAFDELEAQWEDTDTVAGATIKTIEQISASSKKGIADLSAFAKEVTAGMTDEAQIAAIEERMKTAQAAIELVTEKQVTEIKELMRTADAAIKEAGQTSQEEARKVADIYESVINKAITAAVQNIQEAVAEQRKFVEEGKKQEKQADKAVTNMDYYLDRQKMSVDLTGEVLSNYTKLVDAEEKNTDELKEHGELLDEIIKKEEKILRLKEAQARAMSSAEGGMKSYEGGTTLPYEMSRGGILPSFTRGGFLQHFQGGGIMSGFSSRDKYLATFRAGEAFIPPERVAQYGKSNIQDIIDGRAAKPSERIIWDIRTGDKSFEIPVEKDDTFIALMAELRKGELVGGI